MAFRITLSWWPQPTSCYRHPSNYPSIHTYTSTSTNSSFSKASSSLVLSYPSTFLHQFTERRDWPGHTLNSNSPPRQTQFYQMAPSPGYLSRHFTSLVPNFFTFSSLTTTNSYSTPLSTSLAQQISLLWSLTNPTNEDDYHQSSSLLSTHLPYQ